MKNDNDTDHTLHFSAHEKSCSHCRVDVLNLTVQPTFERCQKPGLLRSVSSGWGQKYPLSTPPLNSLAEQTNGNTRFLQKLFVATLRLKTQAYTTHSTVATFIMKPQVQRGATENDICPYSQAAQKPHALC